MDIETMSMPQVLELWGRLNKRYRYLKELQTRALLDRFVLGERVSFFHKHWEVIGPVVRVNRKTLSVREDDGGRHWRVPPANVTRMPWLKGPMDVYELDLEAPEADAAKPPPVFGSE